MQDENPSAEVAAACAVAALRCGWLQVEEVTPNHRIVLPCHHEDSNLVYRVTKAAFYLSNSGGQMYGENPQLKKEQLLCQLSYGPTEAGPPGLEPGTHRLSAEVTLFFASPYRADGGDRTHDACLEDRHVAATPRPLGSGTRRSRTCYLPGFNRALILMSLSSIASRREESNLRRVDPNHACSRYTTSS